MLSAVQGAAPFPSSTRK